MDDPILIIYSVVLTLVLLFFTGFYNQKTENCEKQHNVYKCELVAVPVEPLRE